MNLNRTILTQIYQHPLLNYGCRLIIGNKHPLAHNIHLCLDEQSFPSLLNLACLRVHDGLKHNFKYPSHILTRTLTSCAILQPYIKKYRTSHF
jgi:hypothetical protein